jgi:hypothetical protein
MAKWQPISARTVSSDAPVGNDAFKPSPTVDPPKPLLPSYKATDQPVKRTGQVAVFVSRKEKKVFVRQGFVALFELPVAIDDPDQPLGTHVFTALAVTGDVTGMRWNLMRRFQPIRRSRSSNTRSMSGSGLVSCFGGKKEIIDSHP